MNYKSIEYNNIIFAYILILNHYTMSNKKRNLIKDLQSKLKVSQTELADSLLTTQSSISQMQKSDHFSYDKELEIMRRLKMTPSELAGHIAVILEHNQFVES